MNFIPKSETQTLDDLKSIGFHGRNLIQVKSPAFLFNPETLEITCDLPEAIDMNHVYNVVSLRLPIHAEIYKSQLDWWNNRKLVAWYPARQHGDDYSYHVRFKNLIHD